ncbi:MAG: 2-oxo acid dehydrogenase subunit E2 [Spongiibacteraceae bacterium]
MSDKKPFGTDLPPWPENDFSAFGEVEEVKLSRIQALTGGFMSRNWLSIPHVTHNDSIDTTALEDYRQKLRSQDNPVKISPLIFIAKALTHALKKFPKFNASLHVSGKTLTLKKYYHVGIAIDSPAGLLVGVVRDVDKKPITQVAEEIRELSTRAREKGLGMNDMTGGCMTISSLGGIGGTSFTPIINAPEVAILGVTKSEWVPTRGEGDNVVWKFKTPMSLSYDHRVINGADAARFLCFINELLAKPEALME